MKVSAYDIMYIMKYFAAQVQTNKEDFFIDSVQVALEMRKDKQRLVFLKRCLPTRRAGKVQNEYKAIFPGYIFIETEDIDMELFNTLRHTKYFLRFLPENKHISSIENRDLSLLQHFMKMGTVAEVSTVSFDENDRVVIISGPMMGLEGSIVKVDKRKKRAKIALDFSNEQFLIDLAFNILEESQHEQK